MTVCELKERLDRFPENCVVLIPNVESIRGDSAPSHVPVTCVTIGCNELDGCIFLDGDEEEEDDCD